MSDNNTNDRFGPDRDNDFLLDFPGAEPEDLTEEERSFSFDEDYLDETFPTAGGQSPLPLEPEPESAAESELLAIFRKRTAAGKAAAEEKLQAAEPRPKKEGLARKGKNEPAGRQKAPVTIGRDLRADQMLVYDSELDEIDYTDPDDLPEMRDYMPIRFARYGRRGIGGGILYALFVISVSIVLACMAWMFASDVLALNKEAKGAVVTIEAYEPTGDMPVKDEEDRTIKVDIDQVATALKNAGVIEYKWLFKLYSQFSSANVKIDPGTFDVSSDLDYRALVMALQYGSGNQEITRITFPEGLTLEQTFTLLEENHICSKTDLYEAAANYEFNYDFLEGLELGDANRLEGYLFPDTYDFYQGESATVAISRFLNNMEAKLTEDMNVQARNRGVSIHEAIIIASLIEKEAGSDEERATISSVIYNRLDDGWKLQLDSTINYIKNTSTFDLTGEDLEIDSPYNTYLYKGLPAGPICCPGLASIEAALNPDSTNYWYWYAYEGETTFFTNSSDFNAFAEAHPY